MRQNPHLYYFYDRYNESLLLYALKRCKICVLNVISKKLCIRCDESLDQIYYEFSYEAESSFIQILPKSHILQLKSKSKIISSDKSNQETWEIVENFFEKLDRDEIYSNILKIAAVWKKMEILFEFNDNKCDIQINTSELLQFDKTNQICYKDLDCQKDDVVCALIIQLVAHITFMGENEQSSSVECRNFSELEDLKFQIINSYRNGLLNPI